MRRSIVSIPLAGALVLSLGVAAAAEQGTGAVVQSIPPPISQKPSLPPLHLSDAERAKVRKAVDAEDTEVTFALKTTKSAAGFNPSVGATLPSQLKFYALPQPLIYEMPALKHYAYLRLKHEVLIINPMNRKIVDMFPEAGN
jgi:hypothetical protein